MYILDSAHRTVCGIVAPLTLLRPLRRLLRLSLLVTFLVICGVVGVVLAPRFLILAAIVHLLGQNKLVVAFWGRAATFWRVPHDRFRASREPRGLFHTQQLRNVFSVAPSVLFLHSCHDWHRLKLALC